MSNFIDELKDLKNNITKLEEIVKFEYCQSEEAEGNHWYETSTELTNFIDSLGENARRMLEKGILCDKLAQIGFEHHNDNMVYDKDNIYIEYNFDQNKLYYTEYFNFNKEDVDFENNLIAKIKELIK